MPDEKAICDYLGDGVHAQFIPHSNQLWLIVERCDAPFGDAPVRLEKVCLEPEVFEALCRFAAICWPKEAA